ncbi:ATP-dependent DNA helicase [Trichonephila inaurata madagascariensis]|uniref:ATP-dependent DNA helicase n=1 Tax=Trichonephila inaurata madagascariensis TaxID=2747483 RepID=A0A8X7BUE7_9ARAC|nr:ATP-dependent DNA helicase [Trichonephila inaurata madagascariensis]
MNKLGKDIVEIPEKYIVRKSIAVKNFGSSGFDTENLADSITYEDQEEEDNFQLDFINGMPSGMPPHVLNLKVGAFIMLLRSLNPFTGLCNGMRLIIWKLMSNVIDAEILTGHTKGSHAFILRVMLCPSDSNLTFQLHRRQFLVRLF